MRIRWKSVNRSIHKWLSIAIGLQVLLWFLSGLVMTALHIDTVHGDHLVKKEQFDDFRVQDLFPPSKLEIDQPVGALRVVNREGRPVYVLQVKGKSQAYDAKSGELLSPLSAEAVVKVASNRLSQAVSPIRVTLQSEPSREFAAETPIWKLDYTEPEEFSLYISPITGQIRAVRNFRWRVFDFFWMLHIMDYKEREDFNNPWVIALSALALVLTFTGFYLAWQSIRRRKRSVN